MKSTQNIVIAATLILHCAGSLYASSNWQTAFLAFGGGSDPVVAARAIAKLANPHEQITPISAARIASKASEATPSARNEILAVAKYLTPVASAASFPTSYTDADVQAAAQAIISADEAASRAPVTMTPAPVTTTTPPASTGSSWFPWSSSSSSTPANTVSAAQVQKALNDQSQNDIAIATANNEELARIALSGKSGVSLYTSYIEYIFNVLQTAINSIADANTQQQLISFVQRKVNTLTVDINTNTNNYQARTMGRFSSHKKSSSKQGKKAKKMNSKKS